MTEPIPKMSRPWNPVRAWLVVLCLCGSCVYPRSSGEADVSHAYDTPEQTDLGRRFGLEAIANEGKSGVYVLGSGTDAFAARLGLIDNAERALDVQYYIFHDDDTGRMMLSRLLAAADRGVRVRLLLDDLGSAMPDDVVAAADVHPKIEVRLFNPLARGPLPGLARMFDLAWRPMRLNHRMHNKSLCADGAASIVGGRNVGDEYFGAHEGVNFGDLDLLVVGSVNAEVGACFDLYWNSPFVAPLRGWGSFERDLDDLDELRATLLADERKLLGSAYIQRLLSTRVVLDAARGELPLIWASAHVVSDLPHKIVARGDEIRETLLIERTRAHWPPSQSDLLIVSPYFVPRDSGVQYLCGAVERGVRVRVLTNSLAATDVAAVHAGYKAYRRALLEGGVELYELRPNSELIAAGYRKGLLGSSSASLHAKTFISDGYRVFVGSLNLDPRSVDLNTELGFVVHSAELAHELTAGLEKAMSPEACWRVRLVDDELVWEGTRTGEALRFHHDPGTSWWSRFSVSLLGLLPIEGQL